MTSDALSLQHTIGKTPVISVQPACVLFLYIVFANVIKKSFYMNLFGTPFKVWLESPAKCYFMESSDTQLRLTASE